MEFPVIVVPEGGAATSGFTPDADRQLHVARIRLYNPYSLCCVAVREGFQIPPAAAVIVWVMVVDDPAPQWQRCGSLTYRRPSLFLRPGEVYRVSALLLQRGFALRIGLEFQGDTPHPAAASHLRTTHSTDTGGLGPWPRAKWRTSPAEAASAGTPISIARFERALATLRATGVLDSAMLQQALTTPPPDPGASDEALLDEAERRIQQLADVVAAHERGVDAVAQLRIPVGDFIAEHLLQRAGRGPGANPDTAVRRTRLLGRLRALFSECALRRAGRGGSSGMPFTSTHTAASRAGTSPAHPRAPPIVPVSPASGGHYGVPYAAPASRHDVAHPTVLRSPGAVPTMASPPLAATAALRSPQRTTTVTEPSHRAVPPAHSAATHSSPLPGTASEDWHHSPTAPERALQEELRAAMRAKAVELQRQVGRPSKRTDGSGRLENNFEALMAGDHALDLFASFAQAQLHAARERCAAMPGGDAALRECLPQLQDMADEFTGYIQVNFFDAVKTQDEDLRRLRKDKNQKISRVLRLFSLDAGAGDDGENTENTE